MNGQNPPEMQAPLPPGPVFEPGPGWGAKFKKNFIKIVLPLIVVAVVAIGLIMFLGREEKESSGPEIKTEKTQKVEENVSIEEIVSQEGQSVNIYKVTAQSAEGITHLARRALKEYLAQNPSAGSELKAEHKIYIEDYLKDLHGERFLEIGEEVEFSTDEISQAIEMAKNLSENDLTNLSQYVQLVSGL